jgi:tRNA threonylcarbamoyladenosine biosynthesis protein TsaB
VKILALECATEHGSAALWIDGEIRERRLPPGRGHADQLLPAIEALLAESGLQLSQLDLLAAGRGPGAFTGVRLAASVVQGVAYAAGLPVVPVSTLRAVAQATLATHNVRDSSLRVLVCQDARMGEVYWGAFEFGQGIARELVPEQLSRPEAVVVPAELADGHWAGAGSGFEAYPQPLAHWQSEHFALLPGCYPQAAVVAALAAHDGLAAAVPAATFQPVYLRNNVATIPSQI